MNKKPQLSNDEIERLKKAKQIKVNSPEIVRKHEKTRDTRI